tara:strand:+ start:227 stop:454 length:228 start_codon:yes stop_codon:yes gene_type:complete
MNEKTKMWMWQMHPNATEDEIKNAIEELQDKWEPADDGSSVTYEWVTEQIDEKVLQLSVKISELEDRIKELENNE